MVDYNKYILLLVSSSILLFSCQEYQDTKIEKEYVVQLADSLSRAQRRGEKWADSPVEIALHFFPPVSHDSGPKLYQVKKEEISPNEYKVMILEEGPIDDEIHGERHNLYFTSVKGVWTLKDLTVSLKRRT